MATRTGFSLSKNIKKLAEAKQLSVNKLALMSGMTQPTLQSILEKNDAKLSQIEIIAGALKVSVGELIGLEVSQETSLIKTSKGEYDPYPTTALLREIIVSKDDQLKSKDEQIRLLKQEIARLSPAAVNDLNNKLSDSNLQVESIAGSTEHLIDLMQKGEVDVVMHVLKFLKASDKEAKMSDFKKLLKGVDMSEDQIKYLIYRMTQFNGYLSQSGTGRGTKYKITDQGLKEYEKRVYNLLRKQDLLNG